MDVLQRAHAQDLAQLYLPCLCQVLWMATACPFRQKMAALARLYRVLWAAVSPM